MSMTTIFPEPISVEEIPTEFKLILLSLIKSDNFYTRKRSIDINTSILFAPHETRDKPLRLFATEFAEI